jgi:pimeloyl-ACP methyl ester carboxylesterase
MKRTARGGGDGRPPLLFVHGVFHGAWCWQEHFLDFFADRGWNAYAVTLRGHRAGDDARALRGSLIRDYVDDVQVVAEMLPAPPILVGHSMGGYIVQKYIGLRRTPAAVLLAPMPATGRFRTRMLRRNALLTVAGFARGRLKIIVGTPRRCRAAFFSGGTPDHLVARYTDMLTDESTAAAVDLLVGRRPRVPPVADLPVLVMGASEDGIFSVGQVHATAARYRTEPVIVAGTGHDMMLEATWRSTAEHIDDWLTGVLAERR